MATVHCTVCQITITGPTTRTSPSYYSTMARIPTHDTRGETALHWASWAGRVTLITLLLEYGANLNTLDKQGRTALHHASSEGHITIVALLFEHDVNVDT